MNECDAIPLAACAHEPDEWHATDEHGKRFERRCTRCGVVVDRYDFTERGW